MIKMNIVNFKKNIYEEQKIEEILAKLGCHSIKKEQGGKIITAGLPDGDNKRSVQIKNNPFLDACIRSKGITGIDLFDIVSYIKFNEMNKNDMEYSRTLSINWVKRNLNMDLKDYSSINLDWAKSINKNKKINEPLNPKILKQYIPLPHKLWIEEGIDADTQKFFKICYNLEFNQIVIPIYNKDDKLIGVKARNLDTNKYEAKYIYLYKCSASNNLFGLNIAKRHMEKTNQLIIFEGEKSVMKAFAFGYRNTVALGCKDLTLSQLGLLKEYINKDTKIIFALDKDVYYKDGKYNFSHLKDLDKMFKQRTYAIIDRENLLGNKDAPIDKGKDIFNKLLKQATLISSLVEEERVEEWK